ncbi:CDP-glycerol glycerophosphotransferase family protein [Rhodanobacter sp. Si-c]|uniref:CDP-glycerol glycerophosphotransferase family protein n=1 Tax=Rhodanobacter lycopersici TaxID=3162487 RepID=A0ABV3QDD8_9GAMM
MFAVDRASRSITNLATILKAACCWIAFSPLLLIPRRRDWVIVIGREDGKFLDNAKYFFLSATVILKPHVRVAFVTEREDVVNLLANTDYEVVRFPTRSSIWLLLRAGTVIVDSVDWTRHGRSYFLLGAKLIQLWHGIGYKRIELDLWRHIAQKSKRPGCTLRFWGHLVTAFVTGRLPIYDAFISPSTFYRDKVFKKAFLSRHSLVCGYPRNIFERIPVNIHDAVHLNVDPVISSKIQNWIPDNKRMVLITPTFRDSGSSAISLDPETSAAIDAWCNENKVEMVFKLHPFDKNAGCIQGRHLHLCDPNSDLYPLMSMSNALITDHSSIYMDYLHLDKPVLFLIIEGNCDLDNERQFQFDPERMTPGAKASSWPSLLKQLEIELMHDTYRDARTKLKCVAFDDISQESSVETIIDFMRRERWIPDT